MARAKNSDLLLLVLSFPLFLGAVPQAPVFSSHGEKLGLVELVEATMVPVWLDVTLDGRPEPVWVTHEGLFSVQPGPEGEPTLVELAAPLSAKTGEGAPLVATTVDVDGDGSLEIIRIENYVQVLRVSDVNTLSLDQVPQPTLPGVTLRDMAVGDLNADGLSDVVVGFAVRSPEKAENSGFPDQILMNVGHGRFELLPVEPPHEGYTNGLTLGDVDGDGRLDLIESFNFSAVTFPSRILVNRTEPGARVPVFEVLSSSHDTGTSGMGACLGDLNEDGLVDIYNTSIGADQLSLGTATGVFQDATFQRGFRHEWGEADLRSQWSPSFVDLNGDGLLDVTARHGGSPSAVGIGIVGLSLATHEADLAYVQDEEGGFHRVPVPFNPDSPGQGRHMVTGDWDGDGLPDIALGGEKGSSNFWTNDTQVPESHRLLTVQLQATVSSTPPTGTIVRATCGERTLERTLTWGGKGGGAAAPEHFFAWSDCAQAPSVEVQWPSGARSEHQPGSDQVVLKVVEPQWLDASGPDFVWVDPASALASEACVGVDGGDWSCCAGGDEGPCSLQWPLHSAGVALVRLDEARPMALPRRGSQWIYLTEPSPPRGELPLEIHLMHIGAQDAFSPDDLSLFVNGTYLPWSKTDMERQILTVYTDVAPEVTSLGMTLYPMNIYPEITWDVPVGYGLDPRWYAVSTYPYQIQGGVTEFWKWTTFALSIRGASQLALLPYPRIMAGDTQQIPAEKTMITASLARIRMQVDFDDLEGLDEVVLEDGAHGYKLPLPVRRLSLEEAAGTVAFATGGASNNRLVEGDDESLVYVTLYDGDGYVMPPEAEIITLEVDGGTVSGELEPFSSTYSMWTMLRAEEGVGPGEIRVRSIDGRLVGTFPFKRRLKEPGGLSPEATEASIYQVSTSVIGDVTHEVRVTPVNDFNEVLGGTAAVEISVEGGALASEPYMESQGRFLAPIIADPGSHPLTADVWVDGQLVAELETQVNIPVPPAPPTVDPEEDILEPGLPPADGLDAAVEPEPSSPVRSDGGCAAAGPAMALYWLWILLLLPLLSGRGCRRLRGQGGDLW